MLEYSKMAAPLNRFLTSRLNSYLFKQLCLSSKYEKSKLKILNLQTKCYSSQKASFLQSFRFKFSKFGAVSVGVGVVTSLTVLGQLTGKNAFTVFAENEQTRPYFKPSRQVRVETDTSGLKITLFQFQTCPFCCKVRAVLDYHGFSYDVIEVNSVTKKQIKWSDYPKVPILVVEQGGNEKDMVIKDSSVIISVLESFLHDRNTSLAKYISYYPSLEENVGRKKKYDFPNKYFIMFQEMADLATTPKQREEERKWRKWADDHLVHMLSPNAYRTVRESFQTFHYFSDVGQWEQNFSFFERQMVIYVGASVMYVLGKYLKSKYQLKDDVRQSLYDACNEWLKAVGKDRPFMGGNQPNLADLAVYGVLNSIEGCSAFQDALQNTQIGQWYNRTKVAVQNHHGSHPQNTRSLPSDVSKLRKSN